ncbi:CLAVATA3/ESR (CLE)-related protein 9 [Morella rubra]|uniref:CLAVATA3/ESR (CLE)-related protein 9 n=1 Tax=Morella rubra TaxID=262757 RepID=A0A6A1V753_9ROSI|nr:CLAVATA3/ESR (CLE)-related protein 9 [Morella rubra]
MKSSPSSANTFARQLLRLMAFLLFFLFVTSASRLSKPTLPADTASSRNPRDGYYLLSHHHSCDSLSQEKPRSLCLQLQSIHHYRSQLPPRPSPSPPHEIDQRYGVEKRLVPSGPNPLHNR